MLGERTAEEIKMAIGSAFPMPDEQQAEIRDETSLPACPRRSWLQPRRSAGHRGAGQRDRGCGEEHARQVPAGAVRRHHGQGHRAGRRRRLLRGLDERLRHETGMPIHVAEDPLLGRDRLRQVRRGLRVAAAGPGVRAQTVLVLTGERRDDAPTRGQRRAVILPAAALGRAHHARPPRRGVPRDPQRRALRRRPGPAGLTDAGRPGRPVLRRARRPRRLRPADRRAASRKTPNCAGSCGRASCRSPARTSCRGSSCVRAGRVHRAAAVVTGLGPAIGFEWTVTVTPVAGTACGRTRP